MLEKLKSKISKKNVKYIMVIGLFCVYVELLAHMMIMCPIDSDYSNLILEAFDIIHGNVFLNDWNLTGLSFYSTDLVYFMVGSIVGGISVRSYYLAVAIMVAVVVFAGYLLCQDKMDSLYKRFFYISLTIIPGLTSLTALRAHTGAIIWSFFAIYFLDKMYKNKNIKNLLLVTIFISLGVWGDPITYLVAVIPILLYVFFNILRCKKILENLVDLKIVVSVFGGVIIGIFWDKVFFIIGNANKNVAEGMTSFSSIEQWENNINILISKALGVMSACWWDCPFEMIRLIVVAANVVVVILSIIVTISIIWKWLSNEYCDFISINMALAVFLSTLALIFTSLIQNSNDCSRYIAFWYISLIVVIIRNWENIISFFKFDLAKANVLCLILAVVIILGRVYIWCNTEKYETDQEKLCKVLIDEGLEYGYGNFWNASAITVLSDNRVKVRAIINYEPQIWFCKNEWYKENTNFIITSNDDCSGITKTAAIEKYGNPDKEITYDKYSILVYDNYILSNN